MTEAIIEKISRYNLFNYLFPGVLFIILGPSFLGSSLLQFFNQNLISSLFLAYFIGMAISRVGSVFVEFILKKIGFIKFAKYGDFLKASKHDAKIEILSEENNIYRTIISLLVSLVIAHGFVAIFESYNMSLGTLYITVIIFLLVLFLLSYQKQTKYIKDRVADNLKNKT